MTAETPSAIVWAWDGDREWAKLAEPEHEPLPQSSFAGRRSRMVRAFAIAMLLLFLLIALASLVHL